MEQRSFPLTVPLDLALTLRPVRHGMQDPTMRLGREEVWRATRTPEGAATTRIVAHRTSIEVEAWGAGAGWAVEAVPELLGLHDDPSKLHPQDRIVAELQRRLPGLRLARTRAVMDALVPAILEQKVTGLEARRGYAALVRAYGERAPGPMPLYLPPEPARLATLPYYVFHRFSVERRRADTIRRACSVAHRLEQATTLRADDARRRLLAIEGIGPWTAGEVARTAFGDPDAVSVGDFHLPSLVAWNLAGEARADDARMLELLEPYRGQRGRVILLLEAGAPWPPRRGPRMPLRSIAAI